MQTNQELPDDPNAVPNDPAEADFAAGDGPSGSEFSAQVPGGLTFNLTGGCRYLGGDYGEGEEICHKGGRWICTSTRWEPTGQACDTS